VVTAGRAARLGELIVAAASGRFPPVDGAWERVPPWRDGVEAIVAFTGHAVLAVGDDITDLHLARLRPDGYGGAHDPRLLVALSAPGDWIDSLDVLLVSPPSAPTRRPGLQLVERPDLAGHPRVRFALRTRSDLRVLGHPDRQRSAVGVVGEGVAGLPEISFELEEARRGQAQAAPFIWALLACLPPGEVAVATVAPGNAASLRAALRAGLMPIGSIQRFSRHRVPARAETAGSTVPS
jgi:hypothetical protein